MGMAVTGYGGGRAGRRLPGGGEDGAVQRRARQQFLMGAVGGDSAFVEHHDRIRVPAGAGALRDHDHGAPAGGAAQRRQDPALGARVHAGGGVVQDQDARIGQQRAGDGDALLLSAGEGDAAFAHPRVVALRQSLDEAAYLGRLRGRLDLFRRGVRTAEGDVLADGGGEQHRVLQDDADLRAQRRQGDAAQVDAVDLDRAAGRVVQAQQERDQGRLARSGAAEHRQSAAGRDGQVDVGERLRLVLPAEREADAAKAHLAPAAGQRPRVRRLRDGDRGVQYLRDPLRRRQPLHGQRQHGPDAAYRREELRQVGGERHQQAEALAAHDHQAADADHHHQAEVGDQRQQRRVDRLQPGVERRDHEPSVYLALEPHRLALLLRERLDQARALQVLLQRRRHHAELLLEPGRQRPLLPAEDERLHRQKGDRDQRRGAQHRVHRQHERQRPGKQQGRVHDPQERLADHEPQALDVLDRALQDLSGLHPFDEGDLHHAEPEEELIAQVVGEPLRGDFRQTPVQEPEQRPGGGQPDQRDHRTDQYGAVAGDDAAVDDPADEQRDDDERGRVRDQRRVRRRHEVAVRAQVADEATEQDRQADSIPTATGRATRLAGPSRRGRLRLRRRPRPPEPYAQYADPNPIARRHAATWPRW